MSFRERYGPWAIIAGASEGVGRSVARAIAANGLNCILLANSGPLEEAAAEIATDYGVECRTARVDLAGSSALVEIVPAVGPREIGLYVANAGADPHGARSTTGRRRTGST